MDMLLCLGPLSPWVEGNVSFGRCGFFMLCPISSSCLRQSGGRTRAATGPGVTYRAIEHGLHRLEQGGRIVRVSWRLLVRLLRWRALGLLGIGRGGLLLLGRRLGGGGHGGRQQCAAAGAPRVQAVDGARGRGAWAGEDGGGRSRGASGVKAQAGGRAPSLAGCSTGGSGSG